MKIGLGITLAVGVLSLSSCSSKVTKPIVSSSSLTTYQDSIAYAFGAVNGTIFSKVVKTFPKDSLDKEKVLKGFSEAFLGKESTLLSNKIAEELITKHIKGIEEQEHAVYVAENDSALVVNKAREGVMTTESGLQYRVLRAGKGGVKPKAEDIVEVHYAGRLINGKEFDSSYKRNETAKFPLNQVIKGWTEGLQLMEKGAKYEFYIPSSLGYGERGAGKDIPPHSTLIFEVELFDVIPHQEVKSTQEEQTTPAHTTTKAKRKKKK